MEVLLFLRDNIIYSCMIELIEERPILYHPLHEERDRKNLKRQNFDEIHAILSERFQPFPAHMTADHLYRTWVKEKNKYTVLQREGQAQNSDFAHVLRFINPWITPEPRQHPWIEWQHRLMLEWMVQTGIDMQVQMYVFCNNQLHVMHQQLLNAREELQRRTNELLYSQEQVRYQQRQITALQQSEYQLAMDLGTARQEKRDNRDSIMNLMHRITNVFNETIPNIC